MDNSGLNENHKRRLAVAMAMVDAAAARILDLLDERTSAALMTVVAQTVSQEERQELRSALARLQPLTAKFAHKYGLEKHRKDLRRTIVAEISQVWTILENSRPDRMKGMGKVAEPMAEVLDRDLGRMLAIVEEITNALKQQ